MIILLIAEAWSKEKFKYKGKKFQYYYTMYIRSDSMKPKLF